MARQSPWALLNRHHQLTSDLVERGVPQHLDRAGAIILLSRADHYRWSPVNLRRKRYATALPRCGRSANG